MQHEILNEKLIFISDNLAREFFIVIHFCSGVTIDEDNRKWYDMDECGVVYKSVCHRCKYKLQPAERFAIKILEFNE
jgi:hypothetical protein